MIEDKFKELLKKYLEEVDLDLASGDWPVTILSLIQELEALSREAEVEYQGA